MQRVIVLNKKDNVGVAICAIQAGDEVLVDGSAGPLIALAEIPFGHKIALGSLAKGDSVLKYGEVIGRATRDIAAGEHVHVHNVESLRGRGDIRCSSGGL